MKKGQAKKTLAEHFADCVLADAAAICQRISDGEPEEQYGERNAWVAAGSFNGGGRQYYIIDKDFSHSIGSVDWSELLPDVYSRIPHRSFYLQLETSGTDGFFFVAFYDMDYAKLHDDVLDSEYKDELLLFEKFGKGVYFMQTLEYGFAVNDGDSLHIFMLYPLCNGEEADGPLNLSFEDMKKAINAVAYICSKNADIRCVYRPNNNTRPNPKKKRSQATWHEVGFRIGAELREYERTLSERKPHQGGTVRPHMRRAHWHHYWTGPMDGERVLVLRWIPPTMVALKNGPIEGATGHYVPVSTNA